MKIKCIYCLKEKNTNDFRKREHVIPLDDQHLQLLKFALIYADKVQFFTYKALLSNLISFIIEEVPKDNKFMKEFNEIKL